MTAKLLFIALDGGDGRLLDDWSRSGRLANLAALRRRGRFVRMGNTYDISDDALWASFQYGLGVADHGRYHYLTPLRSGDFGMGVMEEDAADTFWSKLSAEGYEVAVFDIPKCPAPKPLNGIQLTDWLVHGRYADAPQSSPADLAQEVVQRFGVAPASRCGYRQPHLGDDEIIDMTDTFLSSIEQKRAAGLHYLKQRAWDLFMIAFKEAHCAGHGLWQLSDSRHPEYDPDRTARLDDPVGRVFAALDAAVGDLVAEAGEQAEVVVFSTTDMEPNGSVLHLADDIAQRVNSRLAVRHGSRIRRLRKWLRRRKPEVFCRTVPANENFVAFQICRHDRRRMPQAVADAEALLSELVDPETGLSAFTDFDRPSTLWQGARADNLPDLLATCRQNAFPEVLESPRLGRVTADFERLRPGNHAAGGMAILAGDEVARHNVAAMSDFAELAETVLRRIAGVTLAPLRTTPDSGQLSSGSSARQRRGQPNS
ncbi:MAG: hypothetical protein RIM84_09335 [Alphaproteobacteria bacterium]